jgi:N-acetylglucosamine kinase-like BadF-type ATPase
MMKQAYCGLEPFAAGFVGDTGLAVTGALFEVVGIVSALGATGTVVIALSGLSKRSLLGPSPSLIRARESGTVLFCHPLSA